MLMTRRMMALTGITSLFASPSRSQAQPMTASPLDDYQAAAGLFGRGERDEAAYWFYRAQLRARIHLIAHPDLPPDGFPALVASFNEVIGRPVNEYAFGDIPAVAAMIDRVLAWHEANDDPFTPKAAYPAAHQQAQAGLTAFRDKVLADQDEMRRMRRQNGLPNRT